MAVLAIMPLLIIAAVVVIILSAIASRRAREAGNEALATAPRDVFLYLLRFVSLYLSAFGAVMLAWAVTDFYVPRVTTAWVYGGSMSSGSEDYLEPLRVSISMLIVTFPLLIVMSSIIHRKINRGEMNRESLLRITLGYFTLFVMTISAMITLIIVFNGFLNGELTGRFALKGASVLVVIVLVWWQHNLGELKVSEAAS